MLLETSCVDTRDVKLEFFSKSKLESKNRLKLETRFLFVRDEWRWQSIRWRAVEAEMAPGPPVTTWWVDCGGSRAMAVSPHRRRRASDM